MRTFYVRIFDVKIFDLGGAVMCIDQPSAIFS